MEFVRLARACSRLLLLIVLCMVWVLEPVLAAAQVTYSGWLFGGKQGVLRYVVCVRDR
jgi:hypothetical protein